MRRVHEAPDYWVPESHLYQTSEYCIECHPDDPAVGVWNNKWQKKYDQAVAALKFYANRLHKPNQFVEEKYIFLPESNYHGLAEEVLKELGEL